MALLTIKLSDISFSDRARSSYSNIEDLMQSIVERGLIQPIVINRDAAGSYKLVAGGRRYKALQLAGINELTEGLSSVPGKAGFVFLENLSAPDLLEIELEENLFRHDLDWRDRVRMIAKLHAFKAGQGAAAGTPWFMHQTGELLGVSRGNVSTCLEVARHLDKTPNLFKDCTNAFDAIRVIMSNRTDSAISRQVKANHASTSTIGHTDISSFFDEEDTTPPPPQPSSDQSLKPTETGPVTIILAKQFRLGDSLEIMDNLPAGSFSHIITDPPYGIDLDNMDLRGQERVEETHEVEPNIKLLELFIHKAFFVLRENGFLVMWYDLDHHEKIQAWGSSVGFSVQRWPFIWHKDHPCRNQAPTYNFTKNFEVACIMRKGNATLIEPQTSSVVCAEGSVEKKMYNNPFAKPFAVWKKLIEAVSHKGQSILDPFMGAGSCCRAAINLGRIPYGFEISEKHYNEAIVGVRETYKVLLGEGVEFK